jgi:hypothetical protein
MKEFNFLIDKALVAGQHTETIGARNRDVLVTAKNMRPTEYGLAFNKVVNESLVSPPATAWPYPQLFKGKSSSLLVAEQAVYTVSESTWALTQSKVYDLSEIQAPTSSTIVTNGTFTGASTGWTLGSGWSYSANKLVGTGVTAGAAATQANAAQAGAKMEANTLYRITVDISTSDLVGSLFLTCGSATSDYFSTVETHTFDLYSTTAGDIALKSTDGFTGTVDNITVKKIAEASIPTGGGAWQFVDFRGVWFLLKSNCMIAKLPYYSDNRLVAITSSSDDFACVAGENLNNRLFLGGITAPTLLASANFVEAWKAWVENSSDWSDELTYADMTLRTNVVMYSTRVGGDVYWPFIFEMALLGLPHRTTATIVADLKANYIDWIRKGELGFIPLQHQGSVLCLKRLGSSIVAYCADGVSIISAREQRGFRAVPVHGAGIASKCAVSGDDSRHLFLDTNNVLWALTPDGALKRMVGTGTFNAMVTAEATNPIVGNYDPEEQEYYLCSDLEGYIHTRTGLGEITKLPTSFVVAGSGLVGVVEDLGTPNIEVETETFDMGMRALKTIHSIAIGYQDITSLQVVVRYRYDDTPTWRESPAFTVNADSIAVPLFTAKDFRLKFTGVPGTAAKIDYIDVAYQISDKRNIRSAYEL